MPYLTRAFALLRGTRGRGGGTVPTPPVQVFSAANSSVSATTPILSDGQQTSTVTITVRDTNNIVMTDVVVTLAVSGSGNTITQPSAPTNANGVTSGTFTTTQTATKVVTASVGGTAITQTASVIVNPPNTPPPASWLLEDFSTYTSTADWLSDPRGIYSVAEDVNTSEMFLDTTTGVDINGLSLTQCVRYDFPDRTADTCTGSTHKGRCGDYSIGRNIKFPASATVNEVWVELYIKFPTDFTTVAPAGWGCTGTCNSNPDYKMLFVRDTITQRCNLQPGTFGNSWTFGVPGDQEGNGGTPSKTIPGLPWDGQWHQYRIHVMKDQSGSLGHYTAGDVWFDGVLKKSFPGVTVSSTTYGKYFGIALGRNMNQGPDHVMSVYWGQLTLWNTDPGWSTYG